MQRGRRLLVSQGRELCRCYTTQLASNTNAESLDPAALAKCKRVIEAIAEKIKIKELSDWYKVPQLRVKRMKHGEVIFDHFATLRAALRAMYPEYPWEPTLFTDKGRHPSGFWNDKATIEREIPSFEQKIGIKQPEDWYSVTMADLHAIGLPHKLKRSDMVEILMAHYPHYTWDQQQLLRGRYAQQRHLERILNNLFPNTAYIVNARKESGLVNPQTGDWFELDIYYPSLNLAFEYQEQHHYTAAGHLYKPLEEIKERDKTKREIAAAKGITLVIVPFWWDKQPDSLTASIKKARPELLEHIQISDEAKEEIPEEMPPGLLEKNVHNIEDVGQPTTACFFTLSNVNPVGWWMFEKYDGVRGFWNPLKKAFYSRTGNKFLFPAEVVNAMPDDIFLDGELWFGKENFQESMKIVNRIKDNAAVDWSNFKYMVFDAPKHQGTYEERYNYMVEFLNKKEECKYLEIAGKEICRDTSHLEDFYQNVVDKGGEGIILRNPSAPLQPGRCPGYLKHKKFRDAEAKVVAVVNPGVWECELPNGVRFIAPAGTTEFTKRYNPQPGDIVSFKHHGYLLASKKPKLPTLYRLRTDISWEDVVKNWKEQKSSYSGWPLRRYKSLRKPKGYWGSIENRKAFLVKFAKENGFDPMNPNNWIRITPAHIIKKQGQGLLDRFGSLPNVLKNTFPEFTFTYSSLYWRKNKDYWKDIENCKLFLQELAMDLRIDQTRAKSWATVTRKHLNTRQGAGLLVQYETLANALAVAFPELFTKEILQANNVKLARTTGTKPSIAGNYWASIQNCRNFFDEYAKGRGMNPLSPAIWYTSLKDLQRRKEKNAIKQFHGSLISALQTAYPEVPFLRWQTKKNKL